MKGCLIILIFIIIGMFLSIFNDDDLPTSEHNDISELDNPRDDEIVSVEYIEQQADLELIDWSWYIEYGYAHVTGQVKNLTSRPLNKVEVVAQFYTDDGDFIKSSSAIIEYNPILPGQISPFETLTTANPQMSRASIEFKYLFGGTIPTVDSESHREGQRRVVKEIQERLNELGYNAGPADGVAGQMTKSAIRKFQKEKGLDETGETSLEFLEILKQETASSAILP